MGTGFFAEIFAYISLFRLWRTPPQGLWWGALALLVLNWWFKSALSESLKMYGQSSGYTKKIAICGLVIQIALIGIGISTFIR
jgi:hypothetical protein